MTPEDHRCDYVLPFKIYKGFKKKKKFSLKFNIQDSVVSQIVKII